MKLLAVLVGSFALLVLQGPSSLAKKSIKEDREINEPVELESSISPPDEYRGPYAARQSVESSDLLRVAAWRFGIIVPAAFAYLKLASILLCSAQTVTATQSVSTTVTEISTSFSVSVVTVTEYYIFIFAANGAKNLNFNVPDNLTTNALYRIGGRLRSEKELVGGFLNGEFDELHQVERHVETLHLRPSRIEPMPSAIVYP